MKPIQRKDSHVRVGHSAVDGRGVFACRRIARGSLIGLYEGRATRRDGKYVLWVRSDNQRWRGINGTGPLRFLNHSSNPNAELIEEKLVALTAIRPGEEIVIHYGDDWADIA